MAGHEERQFRELKRRQKRLTAKRNRAHVRQSLQDIDFEAAQEDRLPDVRERVDNLHIGRNKPRRIEAS